MFESRDADDISEMTFADFYEKIYALDKGPRLKESTWAFKRAVIGSTLVPFFGDKVISEIDMHDVMRWQNEMVAWRSPKGKGYSADYLRDAHAQLSAIFNHAVRYYGLGRNPASIVGTFKKGAPHEMRYWTKEEYFLFAEQMEQEPVYHLAFEMLYWTGMREGELLALTPADIDTRNKVLMINKTYHRIGKVDMITSPKTAKSNRTISLPEFLCKEIEEYVKNRSEMTVEAGSDAASDEGGRLFPLSSYKLRAALLRGADRAGVKRIRVHDLRHSHVSLLINNGFSALAIGERVGHEAEKITYRYAHLFSSVQNQMADMLDQVHAR